MAVQVGDRYARLTVLRLLPVASGKNSRVRVRCSCGVVKDICRTAWQVYKSCGCTRYKYSHGQAGSPEYRAWLSMHSRCDNPHDAAYVDYGGRGIRVCSRWLDFARFLEDVGPRPPTYRLDRRRVNGHYTPSNVLWVAVQESNLNKRNAVRVRWRGELHYLVDIAALYGVTYQSALWRHRHGWSVAEITGEQA